MDTLKTRFMELAFLNAGLHIFVTDERTGESRDYHFEGGISAFVQYLDRDKTPLFTPPVVISGQKEIVNAKRETYAIDVGFEYNDGYQEHIFTYANLIHTVEGGTHLAGLRSALTRALNEAARNNKLIKDKEENLSGEDLKEGLTCIISVKLSEPQFEGQTKTKLGNSEVRSAVYEELKIIFEDRPDIVRAIVDKALKARRAREAAKKARELVRKGAMTGLNLPGKLADCSSKNPENTELYIVEGDSAGGSAKQGRDRTFQAILPLRGKILNVEKARLDKMLANKEIQTIITALGCGIGDEFDADKLRYHKIIIMTDADVDGAHISTLLLTFFYRHMPQLLTQGYLYLAQPPLYRVQKGKGKNDVIYCYTDKELREHVDSAADPSKVAVQRYKGLGEMNPDQLWDTTMNPANRILKHVELDNDLLADEYFDILMGDRVEPRREFIVSNAHLVKNLDV